MKNLITVCAIALMSIVLSGCPYQTAIPIDTPSVKIYEKLIGTWKSAGSDDTKYKIAAKDEFTYSIVKHSKGSEDEKYCAYFSVVNEVSFLNLYNDNGTADAPTNYYLYRIEIKGDGAFTLKELTENIDEEFTTSDDLKKFVAANMNNSYFYSKDDEVYTKL